MSFQAYRIPQRHEPEYSAYQRVLWDRVREPSVLVPAIILLVTIIYSSYAPIATPPPLKQRLWETLVRLAPAKLLYAIDDWLNPSPFRRPMLLSRPATFEAKSEALARILNRNQAGGIVASVSYASKNGISKFLPKGDAERPAGLWNLSNSCYQNSILQGLTSLKPVRDYLRSVTSEGDYDLPGIPTTEALADLVKDLHGPSENGQTLWTPPILKSMSTFQQQDAEEYFSKLLNEVQGEIDKALKAVRRKPGYEADISRDETAASQYSDDSGYQSVSTSSKPPPERHAALQIPLEGLTAQRVACMACGDSGGLSLNPFLCLPLVLDSDLAEYDLEDTLNSFTEIEHVEEVRCGRCTLLRLRDRIKVLIDGMRDASSQDDDELKAPFPAPFARLESIELALEEDDFEEATLAEKCKIPDRQIARSTKTKQVGIARPPQSLVFHFNRSRFDERTGFVYKNLAAVRFPKLLDLGPWCLGSAASGIRPHSSDNLAAADPPHDEEQWRLPPQLPIVAGSHYRSKISGPVYELRAVITHYGAHENGHYVCYRKHPITRDREMGSTEANDKADMPARLAAEEAQEFGDTQGPDGTAIPLGNTASSNDAEDPQDSESQWWRLSDQNISKVDEAIVLAQGGVFMLFYDRVDPNSVLVSEKEAKNGVPGATTTDASEAGETLSEGETVSTPLASDQARRFEEGPRHGNNGQSQRKREEGLLAADGVDEGSSGPSLTAEQAALLPEPVIAAMLALKQPNHPDALVEEVGETSIFVTSDQSLAATRSTALTMEPSVEVQGDELAAAVRGTVGAAEPSVPVGPDEAEPAPQSIADPKEPTVVVQSGGTRFAVRNDPTSWHRREDVLRHAQSVPLPADEVE